MPLRFSSIERKLFLTLSGAGLLLAVVLGLALGAAIVAEFRRGVEERFQEIAEYGLYPIAASVWQLDDRLMRAELESISRQPFVMGVRLSVREGEEISVGSDTGSELIRREFPLSYHQLGREVDVGRLTVWARQPSVVEVIRAHGVWPFLWVVLNVALVAFLAAWLVRRQIMRPLVRIADHCAAATERGDAEPLVLPERSGRSDELDDVVKAINRMRSAENERRQVGLRLVQSQQIESLGMLAGGIAHDFNNLFTSILGNVELAIDGANDAARVREHLGTARQSVLAATRLTRQMLAYSGRRSLTVEAIALDDAVRDAMVMMSASIPKKCAVSLKLEEQVPTFHADPIQIQQVVTNLVMNAAEAVNPDSGRIVVWAGGMTGADVPSDVVSDLEGWKPTNTYAMLRVEDDGAGMDGAVRARVFEPFFSNKPKGRGLGLSAVRGIVKSLGGVIRIESVVGKGTVVSVIIPASGAPMCDTRPEKPERSAAPQALAHTGMVALIIDDENEVRQVVGRYLNAMGYETVMASSGAEAVACFEMRFDTIGIAVIDISMPGMGGEDVFRHFRELRPDLPVVFMSGYDPGSVSDRVRGEAGVRFLQKPFSRVMIGEVVGDLMSNREGVS